MSGERIIEDIEKTSYVNLDWYYHAFRYSDNDFTDIIENGILCNKLQGRQPDGYNGKYYISLYKYVETPAFASAYQVYRNTASIIVDGINPILCRKTPFYGIFENSILPFRTSSFEDEYQQFWRIDPERYIGIRVPLLNWYKKGLRSYLENVREMIWLMKEHGVELPIYDFSRFDGGEAHVVDQDGYLEKSDILIKEADEKGLKKHY